MADFKVHTTEGMQYVNVHLENESFRAEAGALCYFVGDVTIRSKLVPSFGGILRALMADEKIYRPTYTGTGIVTLESSLGGFHILDLKEEAWVLEPGTYWASEDGVDVSFHRESLLTGFWAGEGLVYLQTRVSGTGKVAVTTRGPVEMIQLEKGMKVAVEGNSVICRSADVSFRIGRATKGYLDRVTAGESRIRIYEGTGKILLNPSPYWRYKIAQDRAAGPAMSGLE